jgi:hypothetical protein
LLVVGVVVTAGVAELAAMNIGIEGLRRLFTGRGAHVAPPRAAGPTCSLGWQQRFGDRAGTPLPTASVIGLQDIPAGGTRDGSSLLVQRGVCSTNLDAVVVDELPAGSGEFLVNELPSLPGLNLGHEEGVTMEADGLTIIGMRDDAHGFRVAKRSVVGAADFVVAPGGEFADIVGTGTQYLWAPSLSPDGLAFYYTVAGDPDPNVNGIYESLRAATDMPFSRGKRMPGIIQSLAQYVNGVSPDGLSIFLERSDRFEAFVLTRAREDEPFVNPNAPKDPPKVPGLRTRPLGGCDRLIGSCAPRGGCRGEDVCTWSPVPGPVSPL